MTPQLETKYVFTITAEIGGVTTAGETGHGVRRIIPIIGGTVKGEGINGKVCQFGADFQIIRPNELIELEAKYAFETDDGAIIYVENKGLRFGPVDLLQKLKRGEPVFCSVRPEAVRLRPGGESSGRPESDSTNELIGEVQSMMYLGDNEQYSIRLADSAVVRAVEYNPPTRKTNVGDRLALQFDAQAVVVLPQEELGD